MSRGPYPIILMLAMSLPSAAKALGLGDIRVDSALNEPLSAQIDIVGATRDELVALTAKVANREIFQRYGADRPSFLSSATFKVGLDAQGRPVLNIRSSEAFTDPLVSLLVDLRWGTGELVREYSLLLDPAGFSSTSHLPDVAVASASPAPSTSTSTSTSASDSDSATTAPVVVMQPRLAQADAAQSTFSEHARYRVSSRDTLRAIARRAGAHSEQQIQRMMIALFRANPNAFDGNINRLHLGAVLTMPTEAEVAAIPAGDAKREVRAHMTAWRLNGRPAVVHQVAAAPAAPVAAAAAALPPAPAADSAPPPVAKEEPNEVAIKNRLQTLEQALDDMHKQLASENAKIQDLKHVSELAAAQAAEQQETPSSSTVQAAEASKAVSAEVAPSGWVNGKSLLGWLAVGASLLVAGFVYVRRRAAKVTPHPYDAIAAEERLAEIAKLDPSGTAAAPQAPVAAPAPARPLPAADVTRAGIIVTETPPPASTTETTVDLSVDSEALERSYLDSLAIDSLGIDTSIVDPETLETASHDMTVLQSAGHDSAILDPTTMDTAEHEVTGLETIAVDTSELDTAIRQEDLNTAILNVKNFDNANLTKTELDYNLLDLDATGQHVEMPSKLNDRVEVSERRTNIADVLKAALVRDPFRRDLRMKLLETYYGIASMNQRAFMEVVRKAARERDYLSAEDWNKVKMMGREIAAGDALFAAESKEDDLADCA